MRPASGRGADAVPFKLRGRTWLAEQEALRERNARGAQKVELLGGFDPFRDRRCAEAVGEGDHRRNDRGGFGTPCQAVRNGSVDLDLVERKTRQLAQRRIAGAEIVE